MNAAIQHATRLRWFPAAVLVLAAAVLFPGRVRAGFNMEMNVIRSGPNGYSFAPNLMTNAVAPDGPYGDYYVVSQGFPTMGAFARYHFDATGLTWTGSGNWGYNNYAGMIHDLTNGLWSISVSNATMTNVYFFSVTANLVSNDVPTVAPIFPTNGETGVPTQPALQWSGPANYSDLVIYSGSNSVSLPVTRTNWSALKFNLGTNSLNLHYDSYDSQSLIASTPTDARSNVIAAWTATSHLQDFATVQFVVGPANTQGAAHTLVAHFPFEAGSGPVLAAATDASGHGYNMTYDGGYGAQGGVGLVSDSAAGLGAARFHDGDGNSAGALGWAEPAPPALLTALAGSFSVSCWIKTTQNNFGSDTATASQGAGIVSADTGMTTNDVLPMALTGDVIGFNIGGSSDVTLNSSGRVNDGVYHHVAVTRNQRTGEMTLYLDGVLDGFTCGSTNLLNAPQKLTIGALAAAANPDPNDGSYHHGYDGELDDLQIYSGVLSAAEIANLHAHPGSTIADLLPLPVNPSGVMAGAGNFQFRFQSQAPFVHAVEYRTNLVSGAGWQTYSNVTGDGTIKTISIPLAVFGPAGQGYVRVSTQ